jgi:hypothetical protein
MTTRADVVGTRRSPALWGLLGACAGELLLIAAWNLYDRRADVRRWLKL